MITSKDAWDNARYALTPDVCLESDDNSNRVSWTLLKDKRVKKVEYLECMYVTEDDEYILFHYTPDTAGLEEGMISVSDDGSGYNRLDLKFHFWDAELQVLEIER